MTPTRPLRLAAIATLLLAACESDQDPGLVPTPPGATQTTSRTLPACPEGGPDATTPAAGCIDEEGRVVRA